MKKMMKTAMAVMAAVAFVGLSLVDNAQLKNISKVSKIDDPEALVEIYQSEQDTELQMPDSTKFVLGKTFTEEEFKRIPAELILENGVLKEYRLDENGNPVEDAPEYLLAARFNNSERDKAMSHKEGKTFTNPHYTDYVVPAPRLPPSS